jgi:hypothetical protein
MTGSEATDTPVESKDPPEDIYRKTSKRIGSWI